MVSGVTSEVHPEHVPGSGPEQDYLSRFFAISGTPWHSIGVVYNFQLHHVPFALEALFSSHASIAEHGGDALESEWLPERLRLAAGDIWDVHFGGDVQHWHMLLDTVGDAHRLSPEHARASWTEDGFVSHLLRSCCWDYGRWEEDVLLAKDTPPDVADHVKYAYSKLQCVARLAVAAWREGAIGLIKSTPTLLEELLCPKGPPDPEPVGAKVSVLRPSGGFAAEATAGGDQQLSHPCATTRAIV